MGSWCELTVSDFAFDSWKNGLSGYAMVPFQIADRRETLGDDGEVRHHIYATRGGVAARRLDLLGFSVQAARRAFSYGLRQLDESDVELWPDALKAGDGFDTWLSWMQKGFEEHVQWVADFERTPKPFSLSDGRPE